MDNLTQNQKENRTSGSCGELYDTIFFVTDILLLCFSFPSTVAVILMLLYRVYKAKSFSAAEVFLLQINVADMCLFIHLLLTFLNKVRATHLSTIFSTLFYIPSLTARSVLLLAICVIFHLAIVHPVTYMGTRTLRRWAWLVNALAWFYTLAVDVAVIVYETDLSKPIFTVLFFITILPILLFNTATLKVLSSGGLGNSANPTKRKAFWIILSILVVLLLNYVPQFYYYIYPVMVPADAERFMCSEGLAVMMLPQFSEFALPVIFLYSLSKLDI